jgi:glycosyltransferase involved in cell wall biosynthesis
VLLQFHDNDGKVAWHESGSGKSDPEVLIVGPYPPPFGGVSSHVRRATIALTDAGYTVGVLNHFSSRPSGGPVVGVLRRNPVLYFTRLRTSHARVVHYHHAGRPSLLLTVALARGSREDSRWLITLHNAGLKRHLVRGPGAHLLRWGLGRFDQIVAVSPEIAKGLSDHGVKTPTMILPAYVRTRAQDVVTSADWAPNSFFAQPGLTLVIAAYRVERFGSRGDLYGLDVAFDTFVSAAEGREDIKLAVFLSHPPRGLWARRYLRSVLDVVPPELHARVGVWIGEQLLPAFRPNVVYLRPTQTEGDALSVREALGYGVPVIASDCTSRPDGVTTARCGDIQAWRQSVATTLADLTNMAINAAAPSPSDSETRDVAEQALLDLYACHLEARPRAS